MAFQEDIFISYAHVDNRPLADNEGWISLLHQRLQTRLYQLVGEEPRIWWDQREQQSSQYLVGMVGGRVSQTLLLLAVVSPRYVKSEWCLGELKEFCRRADQTDGIQINDQPRLFSVVKTPVRSDQIPSELGALLRFEFYEINANGHVREFRTETGANKDQKYWDKFEDLAQSLKKAFEKLRQEQHSTQPGQRNKPLEKMVYLAESTADISTARDRIKRELLERNYYVLPDAELPRRAADMRAAVREYLERSALSIHLIGSDYGLIPEGEEERSVVRLQEEWATEQAAANPEFSHLIWMPPGLQINGARQQHYVEDLHTKLGAGAELLQTSVEDLKTRILDKLEPQDKTIKETYSKESLTRVYLICDNRDVRDVEPIEDFLYQKGYEVILSSDGGSSTHEISKYHRESLLNCDAALLFCGNAGLPWLRTKMFDLQKAQGWGRNRPMLAKGVYMTGPLTDEKQRFRTHEVPVVIKNFGEFSPDHLQPFLDAMRTANGGQM